MIFGGCGAAAVAALETAGGRERGAHAQREGTRLADARELAQLARMKAATDAGADGGRGAPREGRP